VIGLSLFSGLVSSFLPSFLLLLVGLTKSAQLPFSSWLPLAIFAPTPVSALVHSSTLVTAGIYLLIRFSCAADTLKLSIGVLTTFFAGIAACSESDSKKIIALSTLSQLGIIITGLGLGLRDLTHNHLLTHAVVKALLFLCAGVLIHTCYGSQELRCQHQLSSGSSLILISFTVGILRLGGLAFTACYYSKDALLESGYCKSWGMVPLSVFYLSLGLTVSYLVRVLFRFFCRQIASPSLSQIAFYGFFLKLPLLTLLITLVLVTITNRVYSKPCFSAIYFMDKFFVLVVLCLGVCVGHTLFKLRLGILQPLVLLSNVTTSLGCRLVSGSKVFQLEVTRVQALGVKSLFELVIAHSQFSLLSKGLLFALILSFVLI